MGRQIPQPLGRLLTGGQLGAKRLLGRQLLGRPGRLLTGPGHLPGIRLRFFAFQRRPVVPQGSQVLLGLVLLPGQLGRRFLRL